MEKTIEEYLQELSEERPYKIVLSQPAGKETEFRKVEIRMIESKQGIRYQIEKFTAKQAFHINYRRNRSAEQSPDLFRERIFTVQCMDRAVGISGKDQ